MKPRFFYIIVEYLTASYVDNWQTDTIQLGQLTFPDDWGWAMEEAARVKQEYMDRGENVQRVFVAELTFSNPE